LLALAAVLIFVVFKPAGRNTISEMPSPPSETALTAEMSSGNEMSEQELYDAYTMRTRPAHPMLDVKVSFRYPIWVVNRVLRGRRILPWNIPR
jgi:hypothetical protein